MAPKPSPKQLMEKANLTIGGLAERSGVSPSTARLAVQGSGTSRRNTSSGKLIAGAFGLDVNDINWLGGGLANRGRPAGSGNKRTG